VNYSTSAFDYDHTFFGERTTISLDQGDSQVFFKARDMGGDVALHGSEGPSGTRKRAVVGNCDQAG
jgi:hypothetical protein